MLKKIPCISILKIIPYQVEGNDDLHDYDLILTTVPMQTTSDHLLTISKLPREKELAFINGRILEIYERENFKRIVKDFKKYTGKPFNFES